jgi:hypothetical protein
VSAGLPERSHRLYATTVAYIDCGVAGITRLVRTYCSTYFRVLLDRVESLLHLCRIRWHQLDKSYFHLHDTAGFAMTPSRGSQ